MLKKLWLLIGCISVVSTGWTGSIIGGSLLGGTDADQLESWAGLADQDFTMVWSGVAGVATAASFHTAVDSAGATFSVYDITLPDSNTMRIGGYTTQSWGGEGYLSDDEAFIFNLDTLEAQFTTYYTADTIYRNPDYFATFGGGHDLHAGVGVLGTYYGNPDVVHDGYSYSYSYDQTQGQIMYAGDSGIGAGDSGNDYYGWSVNSMEVYAIAMAIPEPASIGLIGLVSCGIYFKRRFFMV